MRRIVTLAIAASLVALLLVPAGSAHAAPAARPFETRLLHDHNDDARIALAASHGFDAIALDARPATLPDGRAALALRLILNMGCNDNAPDECGSLSEVISFAAGDSTHTVTLTTTDGGGNFTTTADHVVQPTLINDGTRFAVEAWLATADLGITNGTQLTHWRVEGFHGDTATDAMSEGLVPGAPDPTDAAFDIGSYSVPALDYITLTPERIAVETTPEAAATVAIGISNRLPIAQNISLGVTGGTLDVATLSLAANFTGTVTLTVTEPGNATITATSALGGYTTTTVQAAAPAPAIAGEDIAFTGPDIPAGSSWSKTIHSIGTLAYHNHHHPAEQAIVHFVAADGAVTEHVIRYANGTFTPDNMTARVGDTITWVNDGGELMIMGGVTLDGTDPLAHEHEGHDEHDGNGTDGHGHGDHDEHAHSDGDAGEDSPGAGFVAATAALAIAAMALRRRRA